MEYLIYIIAVLVLLLVLTILSNIKLETELNKQDKKLKNTYLDSTDKYDYSYVIKRFGNEDIRN